MYTYVEACQISQKKTVSVANYVARPKKNTMPDTFLSCFYRGINFRQHRRVLFSTLIERPLTNSLCLKSDIYFSRTSFIIFQMPVLLLLSQPNINSGKNKSFSGTSHGILRLKTFLNTKFDPLKLLILLSFALHNSKLFKMCYIFFVFIYEWIRYHKQR